MLRRYGHIKSYTGRKLSNGIIRLNHNLLEFSDRDTAHFESPLNIRPLGRHGHPDIQDAIEGKWGRPGDRKRAKGWEKIYKHCKPTPWILGFWK
jgi:hypothetical protein